MQNFAQQYITEIDERIAVRGMLKHPFYQAWSKGELSLSALQDYACQYYQHVAAFPRYLSALHSHTEDIKTRKHILENLNDEELSNPNHPQLWLQFAESLGVKPETTISTTPYPETERLINNFMRLCLSGETVEGVAALYTYESQIPAVSETKIEGLEKFYGITSDSGKSYFKVHMEADIEHSKVEREILMRYISKSNVKAVDDAVDTTLDALWGLLSGICKHNGIAC